MKTTFFAVLFLTIFSFSQAQVQQSGTAVTAEVQSRNVLTTTVNVPLTAFTSNTIAVTVSELRQSYPVTVTDVESNKTFTLAQSNITRNG